jgi:hypothetical protein
MPPVVIAAGIGAAGAIGGAVLSSHAQSHAAQQATDATTNAANQATNAQLQLGNQSLDLQRQMYNNNLGLQTDIYNQDFNMLSPYATNGMVASNSVNALLGLPAAKPIQSTVHAPSPIAAQTPLTLAPQPVPQQQSSGGGGIPGIISPIGALLTGGRLF